MDAPITVKDPVCGMDIVPNPRKGWDFLFEEIWYHFCGSECRWKFRANPEGFVRPGFARPKAASPAAPRRPAASSLWDRLQSWFR